MPAKNPNSLNVRVKETITKEKVQKAFEDMLDFIQKNVDLTNSNVALVGIQTRGAVIAERLAQSLKKTKGISLPVGAIDITLYRDDFSTTGFNPTVKETNLDFDINNKQIILVDDVLYTGRTVRAAIDELIDYGRPKSISLLVLIDRGLRELPIQPDFAALKIKTAATDSINLLLQEIDQKDEILICESIQ